MSIWSGFEPEDDESPDPINDYDAGRVWPVTQLVVGVVALVVATAVFILGPLLVAMWVWEKLS